MLLRRDGWPEENELVLCSVKKIQNHCVFVDIDEYGKSGMIHISEVSPGRIRNIRDFVVVGKKVVCMVLRIDVAKGFIDLSLRRVNERQKKEKIEEIKKELKAEKLILAAAQEMKVDGNKLFYSLQAPIIKEYSNLYDFFQDVVNNVKSFKDLGLDVKVATGLENFVKDKVKPKQVELSGIYTINLYNSNGVILIKDLFLKALKDFPLEVKYEGAGKYYVIVRAEDYKECEKAFEKITKQVEAMVAKEGNYSFVKAEKL